MKAKGRDPVAQRPRVPDDPYGPPAAKTHDLKIWPAQYLAVLRGEKTHEFRRDDRHFQVGDTLRLREWNPEGYPTLVPPTFTAHYTGREVYVHVTWVTRYPDFGVPAGFVVMSIKGRDGE